MLGIGAKDEVVVVNDKTPKRLINAIKNVDAIVPSKKGWDYIASGSYGSVYGQSNYAIKFLSRNTTQHKDPEILMKLQESRLFPKIYAYVPDKVMIVERIYGKQVAHLGEDDIVVNNWDKKIRDAFEFVKSKGLYFSDVHENNIIVTETGNIKIVDVGAFENKGGWGNHDVEYVINYLRKYFSKAKCKRHNEGSSDLV